MARSPWLAHLAILLMVVTFFTGCMTTGPRDFEDGRAHSSVVDTDQHNGAEKARCGSGGAVAALFFVGAILIVGAVIADIVILPFMAPHHHAFCCCHEVVYCCYH